MKTIILRGALALILIMGAVAAGEGGGQGSGGEAADPMAMIEQFLSELDDAAAASARLRISLLNPDDVGDYAEELAKLTNAIIEAMLVNDFVLMAALKDLPENLQNLLYAILTKLSTADAKEFIAMLKSMTAAQLADAINGYREEREEWVRGLKVAGADDEQGPSGSGSIWQTLFGGQTFYLGASMQSWDGVYRVSAGRVRADFVEGGAFEDGLRGPPMDSFFSRDLSWNHLSGQHSSLCIKCGMGAGAGNIIYGSDFSHQNGFTAFNIVGGQGADFSPFDSGIGVNLRTGDAVFLPIPGSDPGGFMPIGPAAGGIDGNYFLFTDDQFNGIGGMVGSDGNMGAGVLEMPDFDLSGEFTEMITTQRGFQANSRIITTSDELMNTLLNLKR